MSRNPWRRHSVLALLLALLAVGAFALSAAAVQAVWTGKGSNNRWENPANWGDAAGGHLVDSNGNRRIPQSSDDVRIPANDATGNDSTVTTDGEEKQVGSLVNGGKITGENAGDGVSIKTEGNITNTGTIEGKEGARRSGNTPPKDGGDVNLSSNSGNVTNSGTIRGGCGATGQAVSYEGESNPGRDSPATSGGNVNIRSHAGNVSNSGTIEGGSGGIGDSYGIASTSSGAKGGDATMESELKEASNSGTVAGGGGGYGRRFDEKATRVNNVDSGAGGDGGKASVRGQTVKNDKDGKVSGGKGGSAGNNTDNGKNGADGGNGGKGQLISYGREAPENEGSVTGGGKGNGGRGGSGGTNGKDGTKAYIDLVKSVPSKYDENKDGKIDEAELDKAYIDLGGGKMNEPNAMIFCRLFGAKRTGAKVYD